MCACAASSRSREYQKKKRKLSSQDGNQEIWEVRRYGEQEWRAQQKQDWTKSATKNGGGANVAAQ